MDLMTKDENTHISKISAEKFNKISENLSAPLPIEQSPIWGEFDNKLPNRRFIGSYQFVKNNEVAAIFSATLYLNRGRNWIWIKHGPLFIKPPSDQDILDICKEIKKTFSKINKNIKPLFIRLSTPTSSPLLHTPLENTMYDQTVTADLTLSEENLLKNMSQSGRQGIRKAIKHNINVREISKDTGAFFKEHCYPILKETSGRDKFGIHKVDTYTNMLEALNGYVKLFVAEQGSNVLAWAITTEYQGVSMYYYGASNAQSHKTFAAYALQWEIMKIMKKYGNTLYDFMGIAGKHNPSLKNVTQFKMKFTKNIVSLPLSYDLPARPMAYRIIKFAINAKRTLSSLR